jgi:DNA-directed RNA polymerase subunit F
MIATKIVVSLVLLTSPPGTADQSLEPGMFAEYGPTIQSLAIQMELLDPHETKFILASAKDFAADLKILQGRYQELAYAPCLEECSRFPSRELVEDLLAMNQSYRKELEARLVVDPIHADDLRAALEETEQLYRIWETVREIRRDYYYVTVRRQALKELRNLIGAEAFYSGNLPPHIPTWRLPEE